MLVFRDGTIGNVMTIVTKIIMVINIIVLCSGNVQVPIYKTNHFTEFFLLNNDKISSTLIA